MTALLLLALAAAAAPEPTYIAERVVTIGDVATRISVFRNGVAVLARTRVGERGSVIRQRLTEVEAQVVVQVVEECYPDLQRFAGAGSALGNGQVELRLAPLGKPPTAVSFAVTAAPTVAIARLTQALDGLEARLVRTKVTREDLRAWEPRAGDRVELEDGRTVEVIDVLASPGQVVVHARVGDGPAMLFLSDDELRRLAIRRVAR